ncbi:MAG TPA: PKD domain-containing protein [Methanobacterium sp.]|nr:PKD domain-containing protein [Methanobacterium sp.]
MNNVNPILDQIASPVAPVLVNTPIETNCAFTDVGTKDIHTGIWYWGDSGSSPGSVSESNGAGKVTGEHAYTDAGIYRVNLAVTDNTGGSVSATAENYVVVYDPQGGFVTGGGWINSPEGAYITDNTLAGKATFGFVSKYEKGATVPTGKTEFQFKVADLNFHSESYDWLVVAGSQAKYKGTGTINGKGNYGFMLSAIDGAIKGDGVDKFRIKIWDKESGNTIYDNEIGTGEDAEPSTAIGGGSIIIHK